MPTNSYLTIQNPATAELVVERSRFIGHCLEVSNEAEAKAFVTKIRLEHAQATHNCYSYRIGNAEHPLEYFNDHGEPSGTAGKPILGAIQRINLTNVVVVVTRYFGGKKLGVRGLIEAYGSAATLVLEQAGVITRIPMFAVNLCYHYTDHSLILYRIQQLQAEVIDTQYTEVINTRFSIPQVQAVAYQELINELPLIKAEFL